MHRESSVPDHNVSVYNICKLKEKENERDGMDVRKKAHHLQRQPHGSELLSLPLTQSRNRRKDLAQKYRGTTKKGKQKRRSPIRYSPFTNV